MKKDKIKVPKEKLQEDYLNKKMSTGKITKLYNCNAETIRRRLIEHNIKRRFHEIKVKIPKKELGTLYIQEKKSTLDIAKKYGCSQWAARFNLIRNDIKLRKPEDFLSWKGPGNRISPKIASSSDLSYILGVLLGDGWIYNYKNIYSIGLETIDYLFCKSFYDSLKNINLNPNIFRTKKGKYWRAIASSKIFYCWFKNLKFEEITEIALKYPLQFLKGIYESEGCLSISSPKGSDKSYLILIIVSCEEDTINLTKLLIERLGLRPRLNLRRPKDRKPIWVLNLGRQAEVKSFLDLIKPCIKNKQTKVL